MQGFRSKKKLWDNPLLVYEEGFCRVKMSEEGNTEVCSFMRRDTVSTCSNSRASSKESAAFILYPKDACSRFLRNADKCVTHDNVPHPNLFTTDTK